MKYGLLLLLAMTSCLSNIHAQDRTSLRGFEGVEAELQDHFTELLQAEAIDADNEGISISDSGREKVIIFDTGDELRMYLVVRNQLRYETAIEIAVEANVSVSEGEEIPLATTILQSNSEALRRSIRLQGIRDSIKNGDDLEATVRKQVRAQNETLQGTVAATQAACVGSDDAICCGFTKESKVRIMCVCDQGSGKWVLCFDSGWQ